MSESILLTKSEDFAVRIINLYNHLVGQKSQYVLAKQILKSGTSIGANIAEAQEAISKADFLAKIYISLKECSETYYWLRLLKRTDYISEQQYESMVGDCRELIKMLTTVTKTTRQNMENENVKHR